MEGGIFGLEIPRRGLKILTKCWKFHGRGVNSVGNSMGGWLTCVGNSMEWSKNAVGNRASRTYLHMAVLIEGGNLTKSETKNF